MTVWIWSETVRLLVTVTPRIFNTSTRWISLSLDGTAKLCLRCLSTKMISWLLARFSFKLLFWAQSDNDLTHQSACPRWLQGLLRTSRSNRSYLQRKTLVRLLTPCMILADIVFITDTSSWYLVWCEWASEKWTSQLCRPTWSGKSNWAILSVSVWWRTVSKALLKSKAITITYGLVRSRCVTLWKSSCGWTRRPEGKLIMKSKRCGGFLEGRIDELGDHSFLHDSCKDRCDWYRPKIGVLSRNCDFGNWSDPGLFELERDCGCRYDTIGEFNVDWKAEYSALSSTRSQKKKLKQPTPVPQ